jgi:hypothetical protein
MKGFEVKFRGKTVDIAVNEPISMTIIAQKAHGKMELRVSAWLIDLNEHVTWIDDELRVGDEIVVERKEIGKSSTPLPPPPNFDASNMSSKDIAAMWEAKRQYFQELESKLKEEGLV